MVARKIVHIEPEVNYLFKKTKLLLFNFVFECESRILKGGLIFTH